jgi:hypothetical protein
MVLNTYLEGYQKITFFWSLAMFSQKSDRLYIFNMFLYRDLVKEIPQKY